MKRRQNAAIFNDINNLRTHLDACQGALKGTVISRSVGRGDKDYNHIVVTSGGFDPIHIGHLQCLQASADIAGDGIMIAVVNGDAFLRNKKGYAFMDLHTRMSIVSAIRGIDYVVAYEDEDDMTVCEPLRVLRPIFFTKGGDRNCSANVPEFDVCKEIGCTVLFSVGGDKIQSSSELVDSAIKEMSK